MSIDAYKKAVKLKPQNPDYHYSLGFVLSRKGLHEDAVKAYNSMVKGPTVYTFWDKLNPEILKLLVVNYLAQTSKQDSGTGNIDVTPDKLVIKSPKGKPLIVVRDKKVIQQYLAQQA